MSNVQGSSGMPAVQEFSIRVPKNVRKKFHMMRFNSVLNVDFSKWTQVKLERENNQKEFRGPDEESPKFGAGSEFGREAKEEARRKKYGIITKKYRAEDQPWILKVGGKTGKKFKGIREGGVGENAAYYVFTHASDGAIEAYPLCEWYNFQPIGRYKALSAEEAEQEFGRRNKAMNYFSLMLRKRLRNCEDGEMEEEDGKGKKPAGKSKDLKISDMDDWVDSDDDDDSDEEDEQNEEAKEKKEKKDKKKKKDIEAAKKKKKKKAASDDSAVEESDDGDEEGRELDYISDSSDSDSDHEAKVDKEMKGVAEESALRKLLASDEEDEDEEEEQEEKKSENEDNPPAEETSTPSNAAKKKKKKKKIKKEEISVIKNEGESSSDFSPDSSDSEIEAKSKQLQQQTLTPQQANSGGSNGVPSIPVSGNDLKRVSTPVSSSAEPPLKKSRIDTPTPALSFLNIPCFPSSTQQDFFSLSKLKKVLYLKNVSSDFWDPPVSKYNGSSDSGITEEAVRRYLMRKPMTTTELLQKFKSRKTGLSSDQLVNVMTQILKKINPVKQTIKNKMYLSLK